MVCYPDEMGEKGEESRCLEQYDVVMCQMSKNPMYVISSSVDSLFFFSFLFYFLVCSPRFSSMCSVTHSTVRRVRAERIKRAITASVMAAIPKYLSSHHHHHYYTSIK